MAPKDLKAGQRLRTLRERAGLSMGDVEELAHDLAQTRRNPRLRIPKARLCDIETKGRIPSIYCLYALAVVYDADIRTLLAFYLPDSRR